MKHYSADIEGAGNRENGATCTRIAKKRIGVLLPLIVLSAGLLASPLQAAIFSIPNLTAPTGGTVGVPVYFQNFSEGFGMQFSVSWDTTKLQYSSYSFNSNLEGVKGVNLTQLASGRLGVTYDHTQAFGFNDQTMLVTINYNVIGNVGSVSPISFLDSPVARDPSAAAATWDSGSVEAVPEPVNLALGIFAGLGVIGTGVRRWWQRRSA